MKTKKKITALGADGRMSFRWKTIDTARRQCFKSAKVSVYECRNRNFVDMSDRDSELVSYCLRTYAGFGVKLKNDAFARVGCWAKQRLKAGKKRKTYGRLYGGASEERREQEK